MKTKQDYWQIDIPKGLTLNKAIDDCKKLFLVWSYYGNLDEGVTENDRTSEKSYTVWVKKNVEADEENKNLSAGELKEKGHMGITLLERIVLEINYFKETGKHLDMDNITLCSGSRNRDGFVPRADWRGKFHVDWDDATDRNSGLRSRSAFNSLPLNLVPLDLESAIKLVKKEGYKVIREY